MQTQPSKSAFPFFSLLFWIFPVLAIGAANLGQANPFAIIRPFLVSLVLGAVVFGINRVWMKSSHQAAILTAWWAILFTSYGHLYLKIEYWTLGGWVIGRHRYLLVLWVLFALIGVWVTKRLPIRLERATMILNQIAVILVLMPLVQGAIYFINQVPANPKVQNSSWKMQPAVETANLPDIYFIVLDSYARSDLLSNLYQYDNSEFIHFLESKGFYIASCSQSNYNHTWFSISTALNLNYLENLTVAGKPARPVPLIKSSLMREYVAKAGYKMVAFETGYDFTDITDADIYLHIGRSWDLSSMVGAQINAFELMYLRTTLATAILEMNGISEDKIEITAKKDMMEYIYSQLPQIPEMDGPKLVYAHINTTHPPFYFSLTPQQRSQEEKTNPSLAGMGAQTRLYRESIIYSNQKMESIITQILDKSRIPPVIIIQGDHGPFLSNTPDHIFDILNAYYFPDKEYGRLYPGISPVNSFRVILDQFFGEKYQQLPDVSYYSDTRNTMDFTIIPNQCGK